MALGPAVKRLDQDATIHYFISRRCVYRVYGADYERMAATEKGHIDI